MATGDTTTWATGDWRLAGAAFHHAGVDSLSTSQNQLEPV